MVTKNRLLQYIILIAVLIVLPLVIKSSYIIHLMVMLAIYGILVLGLDITLGLTGLFSLGHAAFYGMGAYCSALICLRLGISFWLALPISMIVAGIFSLALGFPCLRLKGDYLCIATLGFGEIFRICMIQWDKLTRGPMGLPAIPRPSIFGMEFTSRLPYYYMIVILLIVAFLIAWRIPKTFLGRAFKAIRDDEDAAAFMGVNLAKYKIMSFCIGGVYAGLAGSFYAHYITFISPDTFQYLDSAMMACMILLGGAGTIVGPLVGAVILVIVPEFLRFMVEWRMLLVGVIMVLTMIFRPQGILGGTGFSVPGIRKTPAAGSHQNEVTGG